MKKIDQENVLRGKTMKLWKGVKKKMYGKIKKATIYHGIGQPKV